MNHKYIVTLTEQERKELRALVQKGQTQGYRIKHAQILLKLDEIVLDKVYIWPDGRAVRPDYITARTRRIMEKYGLEHIRGHDLRHTAATLLASRAALKQVQEFLGHEDISTTRNIYAHLMDRDRKATSDIMDGVLRSSVFCSEKCSDPVGA